MERLLRKIDFSANELKEYEGEIKRFSDILRLDRESIANARRSLEDNFDLSLNSVRMILKELVIVVLHDLRLLSADDRGIVQMAVPMPNAIPAAINTLSSNMHITSSEYLIVYLSGILFDVYHNMCADNAGKCKRCGLNLSRETLYENTAYPKPRGILSCFAYCDELYKAGEILSLRHSVRNIHLSDIKGIPYDEQKEYLCDGLMRLMRDTTGAEEASIEGALKMQNDRCQEISLLLGTIGTLVAKERDAYVTFNEISLMHIFSLVYFDGHYAAAKRILPLFIRELRMRIKAGRPVLRQPIRIGCMHLPFTNSHMDRLFRRSGAAVVVASIYDSDVTTKRPATECERCLSAYFRGRMASPREKASAVDRLIEHYKLEAFLFGQFENDRALGGDQLMVMKLVREQRKLFYMPVQNWQKVTGNYITRIESLVEVIRERIKEI